MKEFVDKLIERMEEEIEITWEHDYQGGRLAEEYKGNLSENLTGWIPCSKKMPLFIDNVLVCTKSGGIKIASLTVGKRFCDMYMNIIDDVIAWQPLPEPYKPE